jgi:hypothetical protein
VTVALTAHAADVADALAIAWDAFRSAVRDDLTGWKAAAAAAQGLSTLEAITAALDGRLSLPLITAAQRKFRLPPVKGHKQADK